MYHALAHGCYSQASLLFTDLDDEDTSVVNVGAVFRVTSEAMRFAVAGSTCRSTSGKQSPPDSHTLGSAAQALCKGLAVHVCDSQKLLRTLPLCRQLPAGCSYTSAAVVVARSGLCDGDIGLVTRFVLPKEMMDSTLVLYLGPTVQPPPKVPRRSSGAASPTPGHAQASPRSRLSLASPSSTRAQSGHNNAAAAALRAPKPPHGEVPHPGRPHPGLSSSPTGARSCGAPTRPSSPMAVQPLTPVHIPATVNGGAGQGSPLSVPSSPFRRARLSLCTASLGLAPQPPPSPVASSSCGEAMSPGVSSPRLLAPPMGLPPMPAQWRQRIAALPPAASLGVPAVLSA